MKWLVDFIFFINNELLNYEKNNILINEKQRGFLLD